MKILITNDDGISARGLCLLTEVLGAEHQVYVAAPVLNQSGTGHGLTVTIPLRAEEHWLTGAQYAWAVNGTPADCVKLAMEHLVPERPDIVISGINTGPNLGTDVFYSGTVAGALEGYFHGLPAIAVSMAGPKYSTTLGNYQLAAETTLDFCARFAVGELPRTMLNINVPGITPDDVQGLRYSSLGWRWYTSSYDHRLDPHGRDYYWLQGCVQDGEADGNTDVELCAAGFISVTPLGCDLTDYRMLDQLRR